MSSTIASISPRQTPTAPHTFCAHSPAVTGLAALVTVSDQRGDAEHQHDTDRDADDPGERSAPHVLLLPRLGQLVDDGDEQLPEALDRRDAHPLVGRVRKLDLRAEREHVQAPGTLVPMTAVSSPACTAVTIGGAPKRRSYTVFAEARARESRSGRQPP